MGDIHIDDFYHDIGMILSHLYATFPRRHTIYVEDISGPDNPDEFGIHSDRHLSCLSAMVWLKDMGYIDFDSLIKQEAMDQAVLTEKSFLILTNQAAITVDEDLNVDELPPSVAQQAITNISMLRKALQSRSSVKIARIVSQIMEQSRNF